MTDLFIALGAAIVVAAGSTVYLRTSRGRVRKEQAGAPIAPPRAPVQPPPPNTHVRTLPATPAEATGAPPGTEEVGAEELEAEELEELAELENFARLEDLAELAELEEVEEAAPPEERPAPPRLGERLGRARQALAASFSSIRSRGRVDTAVFDELEEALLLADVGLSTTTKLLEPLRSEFRSGGDPGALLTHLKGSVLELFAGDSAALHLGEQAPSVWLFVGVNGVGKTTTIGKLARREREAGRSVVLAAGDTFRAAAGEQLSIWAERTGVDLVQGADGADPSSVIFDAKAHAKAAGADLVLADTAGRLHTKANLMEELGKVRRIADREPGEVTEVLLVIDATTGQNGLVQARQFADAVGVTGVVLTKLDGSAKGGIVLAIRDEIGLPIKLVGVGEGVDDLIEFEPTTFVDSLFE